MSWPINSVSNQVTGNRVAILGNSITAQTYPTWPSADASWAKSTVYATSAYATPAVHDLTNGYTALRYRVTTGGTSGAVEPVWPTALGGTVTDGTVVWTAVVFTSVPFWQQSWWHLAQGLSGQRLNEVFIVGRSGQISTDILLYVDRALAANPDIVYFANMFENDCWPGGSAPVLATITAAWAAAAVAMDRCRALGKTVMTQTVLPSGNFDASSTFTGYVSGTATKSWLWLNAQIRDYARTRPDVVFFDAASVYVDANPANPVWPENTVTYLSQSGSGQLLKKTDGVHPYMAAGWAIASKLSAIISTTFSAVSHFGNAGDLNYASKNPLNYGTAGTAGSGITSGTPANLMTMNAYGATSGVLSKVARTDVAGEFQQCVYGAAAADNLNFSTTTPLALGNFVAGDVVQGFSELKVLANPTLLKQVYCQVTFAGGVVPSATYSGTDIGANSQDIGQFLTADTLFTVKTVPVKIPAGTTNTTTYSQMYGRGAASFTGQYGRVALVRVLSNPALA